MNRWTRSAGTALLLLVMTAAPTLANEPVPTPPDAQPILISAPADLPVMTPIRAVDLPAQVLREVQAGLAKPDAIIVNGRTITYDQQPLVIDGTLLVPLRAIVEGAGGTVAWDGDSRTVTVEMPDRMAYFVIGDESAEMNENNVRYLQRNLIRLSKPAILAGGRTLIPADALTAILGMMEKPGQAGTLELVAVGRTAPDDQEIMTGVIKEVSAGERVRILVAGGAMSSGEPTLVWFTVTDETTISAGGRQGSIADLVAGKQVEVRHAGPMLMSYPAQGGALAINVLD